MRNKFICLLLVLAMILALTPAVLAADPAMMTDIEGHWAAEAITQAMTENLFSGTSETTFEPDASMTRGMFVTVLGRVAGVDNTTYDTQLLPNLYSDTDATAYYAPYALWASYCGIINGYSDGGFHPNDSITREQIATILLRFASTYNYELWNDDPEAVPMEFSDADTISEYAREAVDAMQTAGIIRGRIGADDLLCFAPQETATRAEGATILLRLKESMHPCENKVLAPVETISIKDTDVELNVGSSLQLTSIITPEEATNKTVTWISGDSAIATVDKEGNVTALTEGNVYIYAYSSNGLEAVCTVFCKTPVNLTSASMTWAEKETFVFGADIPDSRYYYKTKDDAKADMVSVKIRAWNFKGSNPANEKITVYYYLQVHKSIAPTVEAIFEEIYNGQEQFPIKNIGGYRWEPGSEHCAGLAIDINWEENYYYNSRTGEKVGKYWKPGEDPYSIPSDGEVAQIFNKYGFKQGIWTYTVDYMHFSLFGR